MRADGTPDVVPIFPLWEGDRLLMHDLRQRVDLWGRPPCTRRLGAKPPDPHGLSEWLGQGVGGWARPVLDNRQLRARSKLSTDSPKLAFGGLLDGGVVSRREQTLKDRRHRFGADRAL